MTLLEAELSLPAWFSGLRSHQLSAIKEILDAYRSGIKVVVLDAPTGSGKTCVAECVRQLIGVSKAAYVCTTKSLQDQVVHDYPYARVIKGRVNYPTELYPREFKRKWDKVSAEDCNRTRDRACTLCTSVSRCPYLCAKMSAVDSELAVLNTSYFLTECSMANSQFSGRELVIADECDLLESELSRHISVEISKRRVEELGLGEPTYVTKEEAWADWVENAVEVVRGHAQQYQNLSLPSIKDQKEAKYLSRLLSRLSSLRMGLESGGWVYTGKGGEVSFKPILVDRLGQQAFYAHSKRFLLMSATVISAEELVRSTGWEGEYRLVTVDSTFPPDRRPIIYRPTANMTKSGEANGEWEKMSDGVNKVLAAHPGDRVLVHCVSYALASYLHDRMDTSGRAGVIYTEAGGREGALRSYRETSGAVIFAPSLDRGIDLPGVECGVQIIAKVPYANLGDRQVARRLFTPTKREGNRWYKVQTARTIVQMCGRGMRSEDDRVVTYILDSQFESGMWGEWRHLFPRWWREALRWKQ